MTTFDERCTMLWYKVWLETRLWFFLGIVGLAAQAIALYASYPMDPQTSYPNGALGVAAQEMARLRTGEFTGYVWVRWFSTTMLLFWPVYVIALAGTGFERAAGREYLLSLPVTRRHAAVTHLAVVLAEISVITVVPSLLVCALAPLVGQHYPVGDALVHSLLLLLGGLGLFGLTLFLRNATSDVLAYIAVGSLVLISILLTFMAKELTPYSMFRVMNGADYFFDHRVPWTGLALNVGLGGTLIWLSLLSVDHRDY